VGTLAEVSQWGTVCEGYNERGYAWNHFPMTMPVHEASRKFQKDPYWNEFLLFNEHFHDDTGAGVGAGPRTGWSGSIAQNMHLLHLLIC